MGLVELQWLQSVGRFVVLGPEQIMEMCEIGPEDNVHPFFTKLLVVSDTASRSAIVLFDPKLAYSVAGKKSGGSFENNDVITPSVPVGVTQKAMHSRVTPTIAADLTPSIYPVELDVRRQIVIDLGPDEWASGFSFYFQLAPGPVIKLNTFLEGLADRRKMDRHDTDSALQGPFRMGQSRIMGDIPPGG